MQRLSTISVFNIHAFHLTVCDWGINSSMPVAGLSETEKQWRHQTVPFQFLLAVYISYYQMSNTTVSRDNIPRKSLHIEIGRAHV